VKNFKFLLISVIIIYGAYFLVDTKTENNIQDLNIIPIHVDDVENIVKRESKEKNVRAIKSKLPKELINSGLIQLLKPPEDRELEYVWSEEYGCFDDELEDSCKYDFLNAKSVIEARWMKNNGYPTKSMLDLVNNPNYKNQIKVLARSKYPAALTIASIEAMKLGNYREAAHLALSNIAYSDKSKTYPHVLYGEALVLDEKTIAGVTQLFIAGLLGDYMANGRAIGLTPDVAYTTATINSAHNYLKNIFGLNVPVDPRPMGDDGG